MTNIMFLVRIQHVLGFVCNTIRFLGTEANKIKPST